MPLTCSCDQERNSDPHNGSLRSSCWCGLCVKRYLHRAQQERAQAYASWKRAQNYNKNSNSYKYQELMLLEDSSQLLRKRLEQLREKASAMALQVATKTVQIQEESSRQQELQSTIKVLQQQSYHTMLHSLQTTIQSYRQRIRKLQYLQALQYYKLHRVKVQDDPKHRTTATISGLPLPNAGMELYHLLPPLQVQSALYYVSSLTYHMARVLQFPLPHPIEFVYQSSSSGSSSSTTTSTSSMDPPKDLSSYSSMVRIWESRKKDKSSWLFLQNNKNSNHHPDVEDAVFLLQDNVLQLCWQFDFHKMHPGEAILLNLYELANYLQEQVAVEGLKKELKGYNRE